MALTLREGFPKSVTQILFFAVVGGTLAYALSSAFFLRYKSEAQLSIELSVSEYKRISESLGAFTDAQARLRSLPIQPQDVEVLTRILRDDTAKWHMPVARVSKAEAKDLPDAVLKLEFDKLEVQRPYSAVRINSTSPDAQQSARIVTWLGDFFRDTAARELLRQEIYGWQADNRSFITRAQEERLRVSYEMEQSQLRAVALRKVLSQYPDLAKVESRSVVDVRKDNEKFVSPGGQLIASEVEVINHKEQLTRLERQIVQTEFMAPYLAEAEKALIETKSGIDLVKRMSEITTSFSKKLENDAQREAVLSKAAKVSEISARFYSRAQFITQPTISERAEAPRPKMLAAIFFVLFGLLASAWLFRHSIIAMLREQP